MFGNIKRIMAVAMLSLAMAACQVIPDGGQPGPPPPPPGDAGPSDTVLPTDEARHRVALLVPLSGDNEDAGRSIANATTMALLDTSADNLRITTYDTAAGAGAAASRAISDGNKLILGPLMRDEVRAVLGQARPANVPLITFSNDLSVAAPDVFVLGHVPEQSIARTITYAAGQNIRRIAALLPEGEYGDRAQQALARAAASSGATIVATERYNRGNTSIISAAERLEAGGGYDGVLIADGARLASMAAGAMRREDTPLIVLGTELWSGDAAVANSAALRGALYSSVSDARYRQFLDSYRGRFDEQPYRIATLGYDAVLLVLRVAQDWRPGRDFPTARMLANDGFLGLDGPFRFRSDGVGERAMEVRRVGNGSVSIADPAPTRF